MTSSWEPNYSCSMTGKHRHDDPEDNPKGYRVGNKDSDRRGLDRKQADAERERQEDERKADEK